MGNNQRNNQQSRFRPAETQIYKGIAVILLLMHHGLQFTQSELAAMPFMVGMHISISLQNYVSVYLLLSAVTDCVYHFLNI